MAPVVTLEAPVLQVHEVAEPGSVGYGATYRTAPGAHRHRAGRLRRRLSPHRERSRHRPHRRAGGAAGRVSMDLISLDVSALPTGAVRPGTMVELIGGPDGVDRLAEAAAPSATKC